MVPAGQAQAHGLSAPLPPKAQCRQVPLWPRGTLSGQDGSGEALCMGSGSVPKSSGRVPQGAAYSEGGLQGVPAAVGTMPSPAEAPSWGGARPERGAESCSRVRSRKQCGPGAAAPSAGRGGARETANTGSSASSLASCHIQALWALNFEFHIIFMYHKYFF